jgi:hypothetical protein
VVITRDEDMRIISWIMVALGACLLLVLPVLFFVFPADFQWGSHPASPHDPLSPYVFMLGTMYAALGIVLLRSASDPRKHTSIVDYTIYSSLLHGALMLGQSLLLEHELLHLAGDVPMLLLAALALIVYHPNRIARRRPAAV